MKKSLILLTLIAVIFFGSRAVLPQVMAAKALLMATPTAEKKQVQNTPTEVPTQTEIPPPTIDSQATLVVMSTQLAGAQEAGRQAQLDLDAMNRLMVDATITHEAGILQLAQAEKDTLAIAANGTQFAAVATMTAYPTVAYLQNKAMDLQAAELKARAVEPTLIYANKQSELFDKYGERNTNIVFALQVAAIFFITCMSIFILAKVFALAKYPTGAVENHVQEFTPIPMAQVKGSPSQTLRAEIHCSDGQMFDIADGVINHHMTLAFHQWEGTPVHKNLKDIRDFLQYHKLAHVLTGKGGELGITSAGEDFLLHCLSGKPPEPFVCLTPSPTE